MKHPRILALFLALVLSMLYLPLSFAATPSAAEIPFPTAEHPAPVIVYAGDQPPDKPARDLTDLLIAIITLTGIVLTTFVAPWIMSSTSEKKLKNMLEVADTAVGAAWDMLKTRPGAERLEYALSVMAKKGYTADMPGVIDALKASWVQLKIKLSGAGLETDGTRIAPQWIDLPGQNVIFEPVDGEQDQPKR